MQTIYEKLGAGSSTFITVSTKSIDGTFPPAINVCPVAFQSHIITWKCANDRSRLYFGE
ncbi:unnamed protein product [Larinioides sclopetarius]|uniref:Uncharacterized protein n=1 Tax=Larinioides sclopetarius TaxID=280406 RepID=A0AAV2B152_9ARAC